MELWTKFCLSFQGTLVLFLNAECCPLELGFNVMINCWERKKTKLHSVERETAKLRHDEQNYSKKSNYSNVFCAISK